jgi:hypothetical protein
MQGKKATHEVCSSPAARKDRQYARPLCVLVALLGILAPAIVPSMLTKKAMACRTALSRMHLTFDTPCLHFRVKTLTLNPNSKLDCPLLCRCGLRCSASTMWTVWTWPCHPYRCVGPCVFA